MPWCEKCARQVEDDDLVAGPPAITTAEAGTGSRGVRDPGASGPTRDRCPSCGEVLAEDEELHPKAPWHFKVLVVGSVGYLGYRLYQGIGWLIHHA